MQVGEFPGLHNSNRRTIRAPVNPIDKSTIVSIFPKELNERKATVYPGFFTVPAGSYEHPAILVVGPSSWWRDVGESEPLLEIAVSSIQIADSVVRDYNSSVLGSNMGDQMPGLFYIPGALTLEQIKKDHKPLLDDANRKQRKWFSELVRIADILWSRSQGNPLSISDDARLACRELNIENKPWLGDQIQAQLVRCVACGNLRNPNYPICQTCKAIADPELAKSLNLTFVQ